MENKQVQSKKFINTPETIVQDSLKGLATLMHNHLDIVYQDTANAEEIPIVSIKKSKLLENNRVRIVCGGGSGHEPAHGGYVCEQMLAAAVCGRVFASPSLQQVRRTLEYMVQDKKDQEILVIVKNYTGDILNFRAGAAMVQAQYEESHNLKIGVLQVGDDVALKGKLSAKMLPRGVAGTSLLYKILGGAAYNDKNLAHLEDLGKTINENLFTFGVSMDSCSLPGQAKSHALGEDEIEIGMGIHGEPGAKKEKWMKCSDLVTQLLDSIMKGENINSGKIVVMVNNLGSVTNLEMTSIVNDVMNYFGK